MERESMEFDGHRRRRPLRAGGGDPASPALRRGGGPRSSSVCILVEKGSEVGAHILSGAVLEPRALERADPGLVGQGCAAEHAGQGGSLSVPDRDAGLPRFGCPRRRRCTTTATTSSVSATSAAGWASRRRPWAWMTFPGLSGVPRCSTTRTAACKGVATGRHGHRARRSAEGRAYRARRRAARAPDPLRRRLPGLADQGPVRASSTCAMAWIRRPSASASRSCGTVEPENHQQGLVRCTPWAGRWTASTPTAAPSLSPGGQPGRRRLRASGSTTRIRISVPSTSSSVSRPIPGSAPLPSRAVGASPTARARSTRAASSPIPKLTFPRRAAGGLHRRLPQRAQDQGHAHRDEERA